MGLLNKDNNKNQVNSNECHDYLFKWLKEEYNKAEEKDFKIDNDLKKLKNATAALTISLPVLEIIAAATQGMVRTIFLLILLVVFGAAVALAYVDSYIEKNKLKEIREKQKENNGKYSKKALSNLAKEFEGLSTKDVSLYLIKGYKQSFFCKVICLIVSIVTTGLAVWLIPSEDVHSDYFMFIIVVIANLAFNIISNIYTDKMSQYERERLQSFALAAYEDNFESIDNRIREKIMEEKDLEWSCVKI